mmetsp:Transcript_31282/g.62289  ORF Transcript_31282/g.62289 Transcript_31282/m.62289 type:complete len:512 (+) Transcript_31282:643-2178(+)
MTIRQKIQTAILRTTIYATSTLALLEYTTQIPSEGRSSRTYHKLFDQIITPLGRRIFGPEEAHHLSLEVVRRGLAPRAKKGLDAGVDRTGHVVDMEVEIGLRRSGTNESGGNGNSNKSIESAKSTTSSKIIFRSPIGLAAGYDKNGIAIPGLFDLGFSFVEIGSVTPLPQPGNPKPRSFRLVEDKGVINRFGFNSEGVEKVKEYLEEYRKEFGGARPDSLEMTESSATDNDEDLAVGVSHSANSVLWALGWAWHRIMGKQPKTGVLGVNLGKNKLSNDEIGDYTTGICELGPYADYLVINVSSPNTPGLRSLQKRQPLQNLLSSTLRARDRYAPDTPLFVKLSPDLSLEEMSDVAQVALETGIDGMIVSNTTNARPSGLLSKYKVESGGLSGAPIKDVSTECIRTMYRLTDGAIPIIGVGGVGSGKDALEKLKAGACLIQVYSMMVYEGPGVVSRIREELVDLLVEGGFESVEDAVGVDCEDIYWKRKEERVRKRMDEKIKMSEVKEIVDM